MILWFSLPITKVLLESRAFAKEKMTMLLDKLSLQCNSKGRQHIIDVIRYERFHYIPTQHNQVFGRGIKMWLLSQTENLEVLEPRVLGDEIQQHIIEMLKRYS